MIAWFSENLGTILITLVLIAMVAGIIHTLIKDKKQGKSSCGGNCSHCAMGCSCHPAGNSKINSSKK